MTPAVASRTSLRDLLRSATADCRAAVDARFAPTVANSAPRYAEFLSTSAGALWPLEKALNAADVAILLPEWNERSRPAAVDADLTELGIRHRATRYLRHGEGKPSWQTLLARLESSIAVRRSPERAVAGAVAAFACFVGRPRSSRARVHTNEAADAG